MEFKPLQNLFGFFGYLRGKDNYTQTNVFEQHQILSGKNPIWVTVSNQESHLFKTTPELYSVIMKKATLYSNGIFKHYKTVKGVDVEVENSEVIKLLNNPNPLQSKTEWMIEELIHSSIYGNSFVFGLKAFDSQKTPSMLYNLPADRMVVNPTGLIFKQNKISDIIEKFTLKGMDGKNEDYKVSEVIYSKVTNPNSSIIGLSPLHSLQMPISNIRGAYGYRNVIIEEKGAIGILSGGSGGGISGNSIPLSGEDRTKLENQFVNDYGTSSRKKKIMITKTPVSWQPMTYPTKDLMLFEEISSDLRIIIDVFGLNENLFSKEKGTTFTNLNEAKKITYQDCIIPYANDFTYKLSDYFGLSEIGEKIVLDYSHIEALQENELDKSTVISNKVNTLINLMSNGYSKEEAETIVGLK